MTLEQLRLKHPRLIYKSYTVTKDDSGVTISYELLLEPDIVFRPTVRIPRPPSLHSGASGQAFSKDTLPEDFSDYAFHLGLVEAISYWKAACPGEFVIEAGPLTEEQIRFWYDLVIHGLGEFFYRNQIDFTKPDFLKISALETVHFHLSSRASFPISHAPYPIPFAGDLLLVGGGKDSAVTLNIMKESDRTLQTMVLNPIEAALANIRAAGLSSPIIIRRTIDPKLLALNASGYMNGHTPFSAYLAFLGIAVAVLYGNENVIVSNEKSANEGNVMYLGMEVNHQYSKSFRFEQLFREYVARNFEGAPNYFSMLRPLNDVEIGLMFAEAPVYFPSFRSCNAGSKMGHGVGVAPNVRLHILPFFPFFHIPI